MKIIILVVITIFVGKLNFLFYYKLLYYKYNNKLYYFAYYWFNIYSIFIIYPAKELYTDEV